MRPLTEEKRSARLGSNDLFIFVFFVLFQNRIALEGLELRSSEYKVTVITKGMPRHPIVVQ